MTSSSRAVAIALMAQFCCIPAQASPLEIDLPTDNNALFHGGGLEFYQKIEREFRGQKSWPWEGGQYGFVRDPMQTAAGLIYTRFHEGIDIKPLRRDARGEPLDEVRAIADGKVVHANRVPAYSNYGLYVVVEHTWDGSPYYSLYGHLSNILVGVGETVSRGRPIGRMGHTGEGISEERAHLHLELNLMLSRNFESWYNHYFPRDPNHNGIYNGANLTGIDIARFFLEHNKHPDIDIPQFLAREATFYKVALPDSPYFDLPKLYPWLVKTSAGAKSWEISFARSGLPLSIEARSVVVTEPTLIYVAKSEVDCAYLTRGEVAGRGEQAHLTESGMRLMRLLTWPD